MKEAPESRGCDIAAAGRKNRQIAQKANTTAKRASVFQAKRGIVGSNPKPGNAGKKDGRNFPAEGLLRVSKSVGNGKGRRLSAERVYLFLNTIFDFKIPTVSW